MKVVQCDKKHFYDADKFSSCPHCNPNAERIVKGETVSKKHPDLSPDPSPDPIHQHVFNDTVSEKRDVPTWGAYNNDGIIPDNYGNHDTELNDREPDRTHPADIIQNTDLDYHKSVNGTVVTDKAVNTNPSVESGSTPHPSTDTKTVAFYDTVSREPVTGWIVCIKGNSVGEAYNLKVGKNTIGRSLEMNIALTEENSVSRERHAIITFDPKNVKFYIQAGENDNLSYLNNEILMTVSELKPYDKIQLGKAEFVFVPLCSDKFSWSNYISD